MLAAGECQGTAHNRRVKLGATPRLQQPNQKQQNNKMTPFEIAKVCHDTNRSYCQTIGDNSQPPWEEAPEWQKTSAVNGVRFHLANPDAKPSHSHEEWLKEKVDSGWTYGLAKDPEKKEHPCCIPYDSLPESQKLKDALFISVVHALK